MDKFPFLIIVYIVLSALIIRMMIIGKGILHPDFEKINKSARGIFRTYFNWNTTHGKFMYYFGLTVWILGIVAIPLIATSDEEITAISYTCRNDGNTEKSLVIDQDSIHFTVFVFQSADHYTANKVSEKTSAALWNRLMRMCDISTFRKIETGYGRDDAADEEFTLTTTKEWVIFFTNGDDSKYYKKQKNYFDTLKIIFARMENKLNDN
jgi:hypothetical protein